MTDVRHLQEQRGELIDQMKELTNSAGIDDIGWSKERKQKFNDLDKRQKELTEQIDLGLAVETSREIDDGNFRYQPVHAGHGTDYKPTVSLRADQSVAEWARANSPSTEREKLFSKRGWSVGDIVNAMYQRDNAPHELRADLSEGTDAKGGYTVPVIVAAEFIDKLRASSVAFQAGAQTVPIRSLSHDYVRISADPTVAWLAENTTGHGTDMTLERVRFTAKTARARLRWSNEVGQDTVNLVDIVNRGLTQSMALAVDVSALNSTGGSLKPLGIINTTGVTSTLLTTGNNTVSNYAHLTGAVDRLRRNNVMPTAAVMHPRDYVKYSTLSSTADGQPLQRPPLIGDLPLLDSSQMPTNRTNASSTASNGSALIVGNFNDLVMGSRLGLTLIPDPNTDKFQNGILAALRMDWQLFHDESFQVVDRLNTT